MIVAASFGSDLLRAVLQGTPPGTVYALLAFGLVLTYKTSGVFNLALGAQAYISAALYFQARTQWEWSTLPALGLSVFLVAPALGLLMYLLIFRHLRTASSAAKLVVTIGLAVALPSLFNLLSGFESVAGRTPVGIVPGGAAVFYDPFGVYALSRNELTAIVVAVFSMTALALMFRYTTVGMRMRAVVESPRMAELNGVRADLVSGFSWVLSGLFAGLAGVLIAPRFNSLQANDYFNLMVIAIAAAAVGRLQNLPRAFVGGLGLGWLIAVLQTFLPRWSGTVPWLATVQQNLTPAIPFVVLFGILVGWPAIRRSHAAEDPLSGVDPPPPALASLTRSAQLTTMTRVFWTVFLTVVALVVFFRADDYWMFLVTQAVIMSVIFLSITVITGFAGEISLCQGTFAAIGGFAVFQLSSQLGMSVLPAMVIGGVIAAAVGMLLSLPVLRLGGIWLSIATLAFAYFFDSIMVKFSWVGGGSTALAQGTRVPRPTIGPLDFSDDRLFLILVLVVFGLTAGAVVLIRGGTVGQTLRALRGSKLGAESIGISPGRARITVFAVSAFIAGIGGALLSIHQQNVNYSSNFTPFASLFWLVLVVTLGARTVEGALQAGASFGLINAVILSGVFVGWIVRDDSLIPSFFPISGAWLFVLFGLGAIQFARHPEGLVENGKRKASQRVDRWLIARHSSSGPSGADRPPAAAEQLTFGGGPAEGELAEMTAPVDEQATP